MDKHDLLVTVKTNLGLAPGEYVVETNEGIVTAIYPRNTATGPCTCSLCKDQRTAKATVGHQHPPDRITRDQMFLEIAEVVRKRSTCLRGKVGCVIVRENRIIASGYNGAPPGEKHCFELGCDVDENNHAAGCQRAIHAEANAIAFAAQAGVNTEGASMYCTHAPCLKCAQLMISAGIEILMYLRPYRDPRGLKLFRRSTRTAVPVRKVGFTVTPPLDD